MRLDSDHPTRLLRRLLLPALLLAAPAWAGPADQSVPLDLSSGSVGRRLPFDVPFLLEGTAPAGTSRVELRTALEPARERDAVQADGASVSGTDSAGRFALQVPPLPADRRVRFEIALERSLTESGRRLFRQDAEALLRREVAAGASGPDDRLRDGIRAAFDRALEEGRVAGSARERTLKSAAPLLDPGASAPQAAEAIARLTRETRAARASLEAALVRHDEAVPSLTGARTEIAASQALEGLLGALEKQPELDPRNPRSPLALSQDALALARGEAPAAPLLANAGAAEIAAAREAHRRESRALRELRDWLQALLAPASAERPAPAARPEHLSAGERQALGELASRGALRRAEGWAGVLEDHAADAEQALVAGDRALERMLGDLDATAAAAIVRELTTASGTTSAGLYVSLDLGLLYGFEVDRGAIHAGVNVYFAPVNKDAPLRGASLAKRLSLTVGLTLTDMQQEEDDRFESLISDRWNVIVGAGLRVTRNLRLGAGALLLLKNDPNPLVVDRSLGAVPYVAASFDVDVGRLFGGE
jgi:hypothetical protein